MRASHSFAAVLVLISAVASAQFNNGTADGSVTVDAGQATGGSNYQTFAAMVSAYNAVAVSGSYALNANWNILIMSDLSSGNIAMANSVAPGKKVTIKPGPGINAKITFTGTGANGGINGQWLIGVTNLTQTTDTIYRKMDGFTIDGSNNGTSSRNLTIENTAAALANPFLINIVGDSDDCVIKNCIINNLALQSAVIDQDCINTFSRKSTFFFVPDRLTVENNVLTAKNGDSGNGLRSRTSVATGQSLSGGAQRDYVFRNNIVDVSHRGIDLQTNAGGLIEGNTISVTQTSSTATDTGIISSGGIIHGNAQTSPNWNMTIRNNKIIKLQSATVLQGASAGVSGMVLNTGQTNTSYTVYNNFVGGFNFTAPSTEDVWIRGIVIDNGTPDVYLYHNSVNMPALANVSRTSSSRAMAYGLINATIPGVKSLRNNIARVSQPGASAIYINTTSGPIELNYNDWYADNGAVTGRATTTDTVTLADWRSLIQGNGTAGMNGFDLNSVALNPTAPQPPASGVWVSNTDLHFNADPGAGYLAPATFVTTDIDGVARNATQPTMGADEPGAIVTAAADWQLFS